MLAVNDLVNDCCAQKKAGTNRINVGCYRECTYLFPRDSFFFFRTLERLCSTLSVESIYVHECGFELRPLLSRDYRRKRGTTKSISLTQTFRDRRRVVAAVFSSCLRRTFLTSVSRFGYAQTTRHDTTLVVFIRCYSRAW